METTPSGPWAFPRAIRDGLKAIPPARTLQNAGFSGDLPAAEAEAFFGLSLSGKRRLLAGLPGVRLDAARDQAEAADQQHQNDNGVKQA